MPSRMVREVFFVCLCLGAAVGAQPARILYVDDDATGVGDGSSWHDAYRFLQDALADAATRAKPIEIRVAQGVYKPDRGTGIIPGDIGASFKLGSGIALLGGYAGAPAGGRVDGDQRDVEVYQSVLSGDLKGNDYPNSKGKGDNSCRVIRAGTSDANAVLDGFTITGGGSTGSCGNGDRFAMTVQAGGAVLRHCRFVENNGVALSIRLGATPILEECEFEGNEVASTDSSPTFSACRFAHSRLAVDRHSNVSLTNCTFEGSPAGATPGTGTLTCYNGSTVVLTGCTVKDSVNQGMQISDCNAVLVDCTFEGNRGGGIHSYRSDLTLLGCRFIRNQGTALDSGMSQQNLCLTGCSFLANRGEYAGAVYGANLVLHNCEFQSNSATLGAGAVMDQGSCFEATGCLFAGNSTLRNRWPGAISSYTTIMRLSNCTFADNRGQPATIDRWNGRPSSPVEVTQCIFRDGPAALNWHEPSGSGISITYSDIEGGSPGEGNIDVDPRFVKPGYWADPNDPNVVLGPQDPCAVWVPGDYHLQSQAGHWDRAGRTWVYDEATSPCIDAGAPSASVGLEPFPNGGIVNLGAYGGTAEASRSYFGAPVCETQMPGDINGDCRVDEADEAILAARVPTPGTATKNLPPSLSLLTPQGGETFTYPTPIILSPAVADPDGYVVSVDYAVEYRTAAGPVIYSAHGDPHNDWKHTWEWWHTTGVPFDGPCTIRVKAVDDWGQTTTLPEIQVSLIATD